MEAKTSSVEACEKCGGKLIVYSSSLSANHRVQYRRCKACKTRAPSKTLPNEIADKVTELEHRIKKLEQSLSHSVPSSNK